MRSSPIRYGTRIGGCRWGAVHDPKILFESKRVKIEKCRICGIVKRWKKGYKERVDNIEYARFHVGAVAQMWGSTKRVWHKQYNKKLAIRV